MRMTNAVTETKNGLFPGTPIIVWAGRPCPPAEPRASNIFRFVYTLSGLRMRNPLSEALSARYLTGRSRQTWPSPNMTAPPLVKSFNRVLILPANSGGHSTLIRTLSS